MNILKDKSVEVSTLDVVHCVICNELLCTVDFEKTLFKKTIKRLNRCAPGTGMPRILKSWRTNECIMR